MFLSCWELLFTISLSGSVTELKSENKFKNGYDSFTWDNFIIFKRNLQSDNKKAVSEANKELYDKYKEKADTLNELERELGPAKEIKGK